VAVVVAAVAVDVAAVVAVAVDAAAVGADVPAAVTKY